MNKLLRDMDVLCQTTAKEREILLFGGDIMCDGGTEVRVPIEVEWTEQQLTDEEMDTIKVRNDMARDVVDELQDMIEFIESMDMIEGYSIEDILDQLNASISTYNEDI
jgi:hypothetical protein